MYPKKDICFAVFEWTLILTLGIISVFLSWEMFSKYQTSDSTFKRREVIITEVPTITICFNPKVDHLKLGIDFNISMFLSWADFTNPTEDNKLWEKEVNTKKFAKLSKLLTTYNGYCYKLTSTLNKDMDKKSTWHVIHLEFENETASKLPTIQAYFTSENNSYGILTTHWLDGEALLFQIDPYLHKFVEFGLREEQYVYLPEKLKCRKDPFSNCYFKMLQNANFSSCPSKCMPHSINSYQNNSKLCSIGSEEMKCAQNIAYELRKSGKCECRACSITQYSGKLTYEEKQIQETTQTATFFYYFLPPETKIIHEEYIIYDFVGMFGTFGGTLGLFLGFSFANCVSTLMKYLRHLIESLPKNCKDKVISK